MCNEMLHPNMKYKCSKLFVDILYVSEFVSTHISYRFHRIPVSVWRIVTEGYTKGRQILEYRVFLAGRYDEDWNSSVFDDQVNDRVSRRVFLLTINVVSVVPAILWSECRLNVREYSIWRGNSILTFNWRYSAIISFQLNFPVEGERSTVANRMTFQTDNFTRWRNTG